MGSEGGGLHQERPEAASPPGAGDADETLPRPRRSRASRARTSVLGVLTSVGRAQPAGPVRFSVVRDTEQLHLDALGAKGRVERAVELGSLFPESGRAAKGEPRGRAGCPAAGESNPIFSHDPTSEAQVAVALDDTFAGTTSTRPGGPSSPLASAQVSNPLFSSRHASGGLTGVDATQGSEAEDPRSCTRIVSLTQVADAAGVAPGSPTAPHAGDAGPQDLEFEYSHC
jgi:hypothetical protein